MNTTPTTEPELVRITGANYLLYASGIKLGHSEACQEQAASLESLSQKYKQAAHAAGSTSDTYASYIHLADFLLKMANELRVASSGASKAARYYMDQALPLVRADKAAWDAMGRVANQHPIYRAWVLVKVWLATLRPWRRVMQRLARK